MGINTLNELRAWAGPEWAGDSDESIMAMYSRVHKVDPGMVANTLGYDPGKGSLSGERVSSAIDNYQSNLYDVGRGLAKGFGADKIAGWMDRQRADNKFQADVASSRSQALGGIDRFNDQIDPQTGQVLQRGTHSVGEFFGNYLPGLAIQSLPYAGEMAAFAAADVATGGALTPAWLARMGAVAPRVIGGGGLEAGASIAARRAASEAGQGFARTVGSVASSYPSSVGDIMSNQREQNPDGQMNDAAAFAGGIPYAALNAFEPSRMAAARFKGFRSPASWFDNAGGVMGGLKRAGLSTAAGGLKEGTAEFGQELLNQYAGRMAVDPNETLFNPKANDRYLESFIGGGALGGVTSGALGGWRRSEGWQGQQGAQDLLNPSNGQIDPQLAQDAVSQRNAAMGLPGQGVAPQGLRVGPATGPAILDELSATAHNEREADYNKWINEPAGHMIRDPETQQERPATNADMADAMFQRAAPAINPALNPRLLGYDPSGSTQHTVVDADGRTVQSPPTVMPNGEVVQRAQMFVMPNGQAVDEAAFSRLDPHLQRYLLSRNLQTPVRGNMPIYPTNGPATTLSDVQRMGNTPAQFTPTGLDNILGLPAPLTEAQRKQRAAQLTETMSAPSGAMVQNRDTGMERELSASEFQALQAGQLKFPVGFNVYMRDSPSAPALPGTMVASPSGQVGASEQQNQTLLANVNDLGTELGRQRIAAGYTGDQVTPSTTTAATTTAATTTTPAAEGPNAKLWKTLKLPLKATPKIREAFDAAVAARDSGALDAQGFTTVVDHIRGGKGTAFVNKQIVAEQGATVVRAANAADAAAIAAKAAKPRGPVRVVGGTGGANGVRTVSNPRPGAVGPAGGADAGASLGANGSSAPAADVVPGATPGLVADDAAIPPSNVASNGGTSVAVVPKPKHPPGLVSLDGAVDVDKLDALLKADPRVAAAVKLVLGIGEGGRYNGEKVSQKDAAARAGFGKNSQAKVSNALASLGFDEAWRNKYYAAASDTSTDTGTEDEGGGSADRGPRLDGGDNAFGEDSKGDFELVKTGGVVSSAGASQGRTEAVPRTELQNANWFKAAISAVADGKDGFKAADKAAIAAEPAGVGRDNLRLRIAVQRATNEQLADIVAKAAPYSAKVGSRSAVDPLMAEVKKRQGTPAFRVAMHSAYNEEYDATDVKKSEAQDKAAARAAAADKESDNANEGAPTGDEAPAATAPAAPPVVVTKKARRVVKPLANDNVIENDAQGNPLVRELTPNQRSLLLLNSSSLPGPEKAALAEHYGEEPGTPAFLAKLEEDVVAFATDAKAFTARVGEAIARIIAKVAKAILSVAVVFNVTSITPNLNNEAYARTAASIPSAITVTKEVQFRQEGKADYNGRQLSPNAKRVADWIAAQNRPSDVSQIVDPATGVLYVMKGGKVVADSTALFGKAGVASIQHLENKFGGRSAWYDQDHTPEANKITPAGRYSLEKEDDSDYGTRLVFNQSLGVAFAIHRLYLGDPKERRQQRLDSATTSDNAITYGCVNVSNDFYDNTLAKFDYSGGAFAYLLPSDPSQLNALVDMPDTNLRATSTTTTTSNNEGAAAPAERGASLNYAERRRQEERSGRGKPQKSTATGPSTGETHTFGTLNEALKKFMRVGTLGKKVVIVRTAAELQIVLGKSAYTRFVGDEMGGKGRAVAFAEDGRAYLIADRIAVGNERAVFIHEVGAHLGLERLLGTNDMTALHEQILAWAQKDDNSLESRIANAAILRTLAAGTTADQRASENIAYFIEEALKAGVEPSATNYKGVVGRFLARVMRLFNAALEKLGVNPASLTSQDIVDLAYAAAHIAIKGEPRTASRVSAPGATAQNRAYSRSTAQGAASNSAATSAIDSAPVLLRPALRAVTSALRAFSDRSVNMMMFTENLLDKAASLGMKSAQTYRTLAHAKAAFIGRHEQHVLNTMSAYRDLPSELQGFGDGTVNSYLYDTTRDEKWGYVPDELKGRVTVDPETRAKYDALGAKGQAFVRSALKLGRDTLMQKKQIVIDYTASEYDALIAAATGAEKVSLEAEKAKALKQFGSLMMLADDKPYSPQRRYGSHVVIAMSQEYQTAKDADDTAAMRKLENQSEHYFVDFVDSAYAAEKLTARLKETGDYVDVQPRKREEARDDMYGGSGTLAALTKVRARLDSLPAGAETTAVRKKMRELITDMYLMQLAEHSSRKSEMRRKNVAGDIDMIRSLESQGKADAGFMGQVQYNEPLMNAIGDMRKEAGRVGGARSLRVSEVLDEVVKRHVQGLDYKSTPWANVAVRGTSLWFLATNPAYYLQNATQPWTMSLPVMAGRHEIVASSKALTQAYADISEAFKGVKFGDNLNFEALFAGSKLSAPEKAMLTDLLNSNKLDIGVGTELGELQAAGAEGSKAWGKVSHALRGMQLKMEAINRLTTAIAAHRLELGKTSDEAAASAYAGEIISQTHGDYSAWNAPRVFNTGLGKVALQFKKYQMIQLALLARLTKNSFGNAPAEEKAIARRALAYTLGQAFIIGGGKALPIPFALAWLFGKAFGEGDDEPPEYVLRKMIGDKDIADLIINGAPAKLFGINGSAIGGFGNATALLPFTNINIADRKSVSEAGFALIAGPLGGLSLRAADGVKAMLDGNYYKGAESLLPKGFGNLIKAYDVKTEGLSQRDGDQTMSPDEVTAWDTAQQAFGFTPQRQVERMYHQKAAHDIEFALGNDAKDIKADYAQAVKKGGDTSSARDAWSEYQDRRVRLGFTRQPLQDLLKVPQEQSKRERNTMGNIQYNKRNQEFVRSVVSN